MAMARFVMRELVGLAIASAAVVAGAVVVATAQPLAAGIGRAPTPDEVAALDISVAPDGTGLPRGHGSPREGELLYRSTCAPCHGARGEGRAEFPALAGGVGSLASAQPVLTVGSYWPYATTVWDYIHRAMPYDSPGALTSDEVYAVTAYILHLNGLVAETDVLTETTLPRVVMPNRDGFIADPRPDVR